IDETHSGVASLIQNGARQSKREMITLIDSSGLDALIPPGAAQIVVKVDVEGHETTVITELTKLTSVQRIASVFYEVDERWTDPARVRHLLEKAGFSHFRTFGSGMHYDVLASR